MKTSAAWQILAEHAQAAATTSDEALAVCEALHAIAVDLGLGSEAAASLRLAQALRAVDAAQLQFRNLFAEPAPPPAHGPNGSLPPHGPHGEIDPS